MPAIASSTGGRARRTAFALALTAALACGDGPMSSPDIPQPSPTRRLLVAQHRLVDLLQPRREDEPLQAATIADDTRHVAGPHRSEKVFFQQGDLVVSAEGVLVVEPALGPMHRQQGEVALTAELRIDGVWHDAPLQRLPVVHDDDGVARVRFELRRPDLAGREVGLKLDSHAPLPTRRTIIATPPLEIGPDAVLRFAIGVLAIDPPPASVRFTASVCRDAGALEACEPLFEEEVTADTVEAGWRDRSASLSELSGERVRLRLESTTSDPDAVAFPLWANPTVLVPRDVPGSRPNILLISLDTLRADHLGSYGYPRDTAPFLDEAFARGGTLFENPVAAAASTGPSHMSIMTGHDAVVHRVANLWDRLSPAIATLAEALRGAGLSTAAVTENAALTLGQGFHRGFDRYMENKTTRLRDFTGQVDRTLERAVAWLGRHGDERFFLFLHTYQVHYPYSPPEAYDQFFREPISPPPHPGIPPDRAPVLYDREIRYLDDQLRGFFQQLDDLGLARDTIVVVTSDHGDEFYEHDFLDHGGSLFNSAIHVPLMFRGPRIPAGRRIAQPVGHVDLMPTLLELAGVEVPEDLDGRSFAAAFAAREGFEAAPPAALLSETRVPWARTRGAKGGIAPVHPPTLAVREGDRKLILRRTGPAAAGFLYYDLARDPDEQNDLYSERGDEAQRLKQLLQSQRMRGLGARRRYPNRLPDDPAASARGVGTIDPEYEEKLRALGYIE